MGVLKQAFEQLFRRQTSALIIPLQWRLHFLITPHPVHSLADAKAHFFSIRIAAMFFFFNLSSIFERFSFLLSNQCSV